MKQKELEEILQTALKGKGIDSMTFQEMREAMIAMTGIIVGILLITNKSAEEIKQIIK